MSSLVAAEAGGEDARALAERLTAPLESAIRLMLLDALSAAADEITRELAPGLGRAAAARRRARLRRDAGAGRRAGRAGARRRRRPRRRTPTRRATARINLRLPEQLKAGIEQAAEPRAAVRQRLARPRRRRRARRRPTTAARAARRPARPALHRLGALTATVRPSPPVFEPDRRRASPCRPSTPRTDLRHDRPRHRRRPDQRRRPRRHGRRGAAERPVQRGGPQGRRADPRRVRARAAAGQGAEAALVADAATAGRST